MNKPEIMRSHTARAIAVAAVFAGLIGLIATGIWALDTPKVHSQLYFVEDTDGDFSIPPVAPDPTVSAAGLWQFTPAPDGRLPMSLWLAIPASTALVGGAFGAIASAAGVRVTRH